MELGLFAFYSIFVAATISVAIEPGPVQVRLAKETALFGRKNGIWLNLGTQTANLQTLAVVVCGLSFLVEVHSVFLDLLRWLGIAYLAWGAISLVRSRVGTDEANQNSGKGFDTTILASRPLLASFRQGYLMQSLNPIPWGFFAAYLPIWLRHDLQVVLVWQLVMLSGALLVVFFACDCVFVLLVARVKRSLVRSPFFAQLFKWIGATWLGVLACRLVFDRQ